MSRHRILLVDDEESILAVLTPDLQRQGYEVDTATSGEDGIEMFKKCEPDLVITDIRMKGITGIAHGSINLCFRTVR